MRKKILTLMLVALSLTAAAVVVVLTLMHQRATKQSFDEQLSTLVGFSIDNVQLGLATGEMAAVKATLGRLQTYSIFEGAILFDEELTPLLTMPEDYALQQSLINQVIERGKVMKDQISYEAGVLKDEDGEIIGNLLIAFTLAPVTAEARKGLIYASTIGLFILLTVIMITILQVRRMIKPLEKTVSVVEAVAQGDLSQRLEIKSKDEIGELATTINKMAAALKMHEDGIQATVNMANSVVEEVNRTADQLKAGLIGERASVGDATGDYKLMVERFNASLDTVVYPVLETIEILKAYAKGDLSHKLSALPGDLQVLPDTLNEIQTNLKALIAEGLSLAQATAAGRLKYRGDETKFEGGYRAVIDGMNKSIENILKPVNEAVGCLKEMSRGNFSVSVTGDYQGDHAIMKEAMNSTLDSLNALLGQFAKMVEQVANGTRRVSESSHLLSQGATIQASSIQEVTASMEQIGSKTRQNADNAAKANQLSQTAKNHADNGNKQMKKMLTAMGEINQSSEEISQIIKTIDEIAFQTNLLALNAAVEAARAGVHGKGFAVVAEEVRNLALRSAQAAEKTTELIEDTVSKVGNGTKIANMTAKSLEEIVKSATKVTDLIEEIAAGSKEQALGINQINTGLDQINKVTQSNTATAEESASAAEELSNQAAQLRRLLKKFKLKNHNDPGWGHETSLSTTYDMPESEGIDTCGESSKANQSQDVVHIVKSDLTALDDEEFGKY